MSARVRDPLALTTLSYLALPLLVFACGMLRWYVAAPFVAAVVAGFGLTARELRRAPLASWDLRLTWQDLLLVAVVAAVWLSVSGVGGLGLQNSDYGKHNSLLFHLATDRWPPTFDTSYLADQGLGARSPMVYFLGYYIVPGLIGQLAGGWTAANVAMILWTLVGLTLALLWFGRLVGGDPVRAALLFVGLSGADIVGQYLLNHTFPPMTEHIEWWNGLFQYSSNTAMVLWVPQHALSGWLLGALFLAYREDGRALRCLGFFGALAAYWSGFTAMGLALLAAVTFRPAQWRHAFSWQNLVIGPPLVALMAAYVASNPFGVVKGWAWQFTNWRHLLEVYGTFVFWEFGALALLCARQLLEPGGRAYAGALVILLALPFYKVGEFNDFPMRVSIVPLLAFWVAVARETLEPAVPRGARHALLCALLAVGAVTPFTEIARSLQDGRLEVPPHTPQEFGKDDGTPKEVARQYFGRADAFFFRALARQLPR